MDTYAGIFDADSSLRRAISLPNLTSLGGPRGLRSKRLESLREPAGFLATMVVFFLLIALLPTLWVVFFLHVLPHEHMEVSFSMWLTCVAARHYARAAVVKRVTSEMKDVLVGGEIFVIAAQVCSITANAAFMMHTPGPPLFDLGFYLIPEQGIDSPMRPLSDTMTVTLSFMLIIYGSLFEDRKTRALVFKDWFRLVSINYFLRSFAFVVTSLPGPAPHCASDSPNYSPPETYTDVLTRLGPMYGQFYTCGDLLFSGHAAWTTTTILLILRTTRRHPMHELRQVIGAVYVLIMCTLALAGRKHYTVDLFLGVAMSSLIYSHFQHSWTGGARVPASRCPSLKSESSKCDVDMLEMTGSGAGSPVDGEEAMNLLV